jgi:Fic/DOC family
LMKFYKDNSISSEVDPAWLAAMMHYKFVRIHPFDDGNGRTARLIMNYILLKNNYPPAIIRSSKKDKDEYLYALNQADVGNDEFFQNYIYEQVIHSLEISIKAAKGENIEERYDWEKELDIFKKDLKSREETNLLKSRLVLQDIYKNSLYKLFVAIENNLSKFHDLFNKVGYYYNVQNYVITNILTAQGTNLDYVENQIFFDHKNPEKYGYIGIKPKFEAEKNLIENFQYPDIRRINIAYQFIGFKKAGADPFDVYLGFVIVLDELTYVVGSSEIKVNVKKTYKQYLSEDECEEIAVKAAKKVLSDIKTNSEVQ